jgi:hypothetical protein
MTGSKTARTLADEHRLGNLVIGRVTAAIAVAFALAVAAIPLLR